MTDEEIRALCVKAATERRHYSGGANSLGGGGLDVLAQAERIYLWIKASDAPTTKSSGGTTGSADGAGMVRSYCEV